MASTDKPTHDSGKLAPESHVSHDAPPVYKLFVLDLSLRLLLFASTLAAVLVMVTSKQTKLIPVALFPTGVPLAAKFNHSPAFIYFVAALSVACLYSIITTLGSILAKSKRCSSKLLFHFALIDVLMLAIVASAAGTAGAVAYIGLKGNSHVGWQKVCNTYDKFCRHIGISVAVSLFASVLLVLLVLLSTYSLHRRIR
ncbi:hypothetical protein HHK36_012484 [Tetracentron sinense]|uniref:CASP-like protein n=1 Tax=Tetracentron sinense TaxID=13715 RepID=A0A834ZFE7_TETSI|nr:hypothetical protein HHK36_012484 [Tetracentron sinense]